MNPLRTPRLDLLASHRRPWSASSPSTSSYCSSLSSLAFGSAEEYEYLSESVLREATGHDDLSCVRKLELVIDLESQSLGNLGAKLTHLVELKLSGSTIRSLRDLGTSLGNVRVLWLNRCGLRDLDGVSGFPELRELYASYNDVSDVSALAMAEHLQVLDLEGNCIDDLSQLQYLVGCSDLRSVSFDGNPICDEEEYRNYASKILPQVQVLDDQPVSKDERILASSFSCQLQTDSSSSKVRKVDSNRSTIEKEAGVDAERTLVTESIKHARVGLDAVTIGSMTVIPDESGSTRPMTATSISEAAILQRPLSARVLGGSRASSGFSLPSAPWNVGSLTFSSDGSVGDEEEDPSSELTHGGSAVICGNLSNSLRSRRSHQSTNSRTSFSSSSSQQEEFPLPSFSSSRPFSKQNTRFECVEDFLDEIRHWKMETADAVLAPDPDELIDFASGGFSDSYTLDSLPPSNDDVDEFSRTKNAATRDPCLPSPMRNISSSRKISGPDRKETKGSSSYVDLSSSSTYGFRTDSGAMSHKLDLSSSSDDFENRPPLSVSSGSVVKKHSQDTHALTEDFQQLGLDSSLPLVVGRLRPSSRHSVRLFANSMMESNPNESSPS